MVIIMQENRNTSVCNQQSTNILGCNGTVCIDTQRVLDCCRDRDCFEDTRVYLTAQGEEILSNSTNVRTRYARLIWAYVGLDEIPFNCGFYQVSVRYYVEVEFEACGGSCRSQTFKGLAVLEKNVVLYGGEGKAVSFTSNPANSYCCIGDLNTATTNAPTAIVETVEPVVLGTKVPECGCSCPCPCGEYSDIPECVRNIFGDCLVTNSTAPKIYVSFGIFSVIRIVRPAQLLVNATDYSVPDKECTQATNNDNPCALFRSIAFPVAQFRGTDCPAEDTTQKKNGGSCGCGK